MRRAASLLALALLVLPAAFAEEAASPSLSAPSAESEAEKQWKELQAQEQWVVRLKKQVQGETNQLSEMRARLAQQFKLDLKKLEAGAYTYDSKSDKFVDKTAPTPAVAAK